MSLSQKHMGKVFVPWFNAEEWKTVYNVLFSQTNQNYSQALNIIKIWKNRTPLLSAGVEGTLIILDALLTEKENLVEQQLTQIYAISIMRFLNICATNNEKQGTFYKTALKNELPKWLINIRHDIAHDHRLPSLSILELGLSQCLEWIKIKYWQVQNEIVTDYIVTEESSNAKLIDILKIYIQFNLNLLSKDIDISHYDETILTKINDILFKKATQPTTDISDIISVLEEFLSECLTKLTDDDQELVLKIVVNDALLSTELEMSSVGTHFIPRNFRHIWSNLLNILNENNYIFKILNHLVQTVNNIELENTVRKTAALWIAELLHGLQKAQLIEEECSNMEKENTNKFDITTLFKIKSDVEEKHPEFEDCLDFFSANTYSSEAREFQDKILNMPNDYTLYFLEQTLRFNNSSENYITDMVNLVEKMLLPNEQATNGEIFTTDHLKDVNISSRSLDETDSEQTIIVDVNSYNTDFGETRWKPVKDQMIYKGCPLGVLPHQNRIKNPLLAL